MVAVLAATPKPTSVGVIAASTTPRPPGVMGMAARTPASPKATSRLMGFTDAPNARRNTHSAAASSSQLIAAQSAPRLRSSGWRASSWSRSASWWTNRDAVSSCT